MGWLPPFPLFCASTPLTGRETGNPQGQPPYCTVRAKGPGEGKGFAQDGMVRLCQRLLTPQTPGSWEARALLCLFNTDSSNYKRTRLGGRTGRGWNVDALNFIFIIRRFSGKTIVPAYTGKWPMLMSGSCGKRCILTLFLQKSYSSISNCQSTFQQRKTCAHTSAQMALIRLSCRFKKI